MRVERVEVHLLRVPFDMGAAPKAFAGMGWTSVDSLFVRVCTDIEEMLFVGLSMSLQQVVERIASVCGKTPQNATALKQYFQTPSCDRTDQADKYFQADRSIVALA